jgi:hypothetical protein
MNDKYYETGDVKPTDAEGALSLVYAYTSNSYAMYSALIDCSISFSAEDKLRFRGVVAEAAEVVNIIRAAHPATAEKVDSFRLAFRRVVVPPLKERIPGEAHIQVDHGTES